ncbi:hypothetical protein GCM10023144_01520 [Pigmentiphaga soli]|uniref:Uncharacterized protein n=1 Tax=Pigmentiphaga soli TaxID=1007095 RepID=A0ABP8GCX8_9BURK
MPENVSPPTLEEIAGITQDEIVQFLTERVKNHPCPACGTNKWEVAMAPDYVFGLIGLNKNNSFSMPPPLAPLISVVCSHCGYIRSHAANALAIWKRNKPAKA